MPSSKEFLAGLSSEIFPHNFSIALTSRPGYLSVIFCVLFKLLVAFLKSDYAQLSSNQIKLNISKSKAITKILSRNLYCDFN